MLKYISIRLKKVSANMKKYPTWQYHVRKIGLGTWDLLQFYCISCQAIQKKHVSSLLSSEFDKMTEKKKSNDFNSLQI